MADFLDKCLAAVDPVKFVHLRQQEAWVDIADGSVTYHPAPNGGVTIAYVMGADEGQTWQIDFATAQCSPRDNYNKKVGRAIARGRLARNPDIPGLWVSDSLSGTEITNAVIEAALISLEKA